MIKYDTKEIVNLFLDAKNNYYCCKHWLDNHYNDYLKDNSYNLHLCNMNFYYGEMNAYKRIILSFFGVSIKYFDKFINSVVFGGGYENI